MSYPKLRRQIRSDISLIRVIDSIALAQNETAVRLAILEMMVP